MRTLAISASIIFSVALVVYIGSRADNGFRALSLVIACASGFILGVIVGTVSSQREIQRQHQAELERERSRHRARTWGPVVSITGLIESGEEDRPRRADN